MRAVFVGGGPLSVMTVKQLVQRGHEVVIVERERERIDALSEALDCGLLHGDGTKPALLAEANPDQTDFLFCLTDNDQSNILASLVGRSLGFSRIVTKIEDPEFEHICVELGLEDTIIPARTIGRLLAGMAEGQDPLELSTKIKDEARVFSFIAGKDDEGTVESLKLPEQARVICLYRDGRFMHTESDTQLRSDDEVVILAHRKAVPELHERWTTQSG